MLTPFPEQVEDAAFLNGLRRRALWSEPGTGKTLTTVTALGQRTALIIAPASVTTMWARMFPEGEAAVLDRETLGLIPRPRVSIVSWGLIPYLQAEDLLPQTVDGLVLDEAHRAVRDTAKRTDVVFGRKGLWQRAGSVWPLTGTPMIRFADDLWPVCSALWPNHLDALGIRSRAKFLNRFAVMRDGRPVASRDWALKALHSILDGKGEPPRVVARRRLVDVAKHLPPITSTPLEVRLTATQRGMVNDLLPDDVLARLESASSLALADDTHIATARRAVGSMKINAAVDHIEDRTGKLIVAYYHTDVGDALFKVLKNRGAPALKIDGATAGFERQHIEDVFNTAPEPYVLVLQLTAGGEGLNPHKDCARMLVVERDWSGAMMQQLIGRIRRMGQTQHQHVDFLDSDHPVDAAVRRSGASKLRSLGILTGDN